MAVKFSEAIRRWVGWCPNATATGFSRRYAAPDDEVGIGTAAGGDREVMEGVLVDYGLTGTPAMYFILLVAGALLIGCLAVTSPAGRLPLLAVILAYAGMELYGAVRRARIEIARGAIIIRRPLFPSIVIPKDAVVKAEVMENKPPVSFRLLVVALTAIFVSAAGSMYVGFENPTSMRFIFGFAAVILFPVLFYRAYARTRYPRTLTITTTEKRIAAIYTDAPERIAGALEGFR